MRKTTVIQCVLGAAVLLAAVYSFLGGGAPPLRIRIATGGDSGVYYAYGNVLAKNLEKRLGVPVSVIASGGSAENVRLLKSGRAELAFVQNDIVTYAYNGTYLFSTEGSFKDCSVVAALYPEVCHAVALREIEGISGLQNRRVSVGDEGSGTELNASQILGVYGLTFADIDAVHLGFAASVKAFRESEIDAFFCTAGVPTPAVNELAKEGKARLLPVGEAHARLLASQYPFYSRLTIPQGTYEGFDEDEDTEAVAVRALLVAGGKLGKQAVNEVLQTLFDSREEIAAITPEGGKLTRESAVDNLPIPLHPGAEAYFFGK
jgi:TRAP transporter TAXI family solute receptor